ncbi:hypothetical protein FDECE_18548 [Fusarium decemcellulare]|nr:hypothetical protein FDECE_18548 [Fusarium decemcellulare]
MQLRGGIWYGVILWLSAVAYASIGDDTCPNGFAIVELQPYEIVFYNMPGSPVVTGTKTMTEFPQYGYTNIIVPDGHNDHAHHSEWPNSPGSDHSHCAGCVTVTTAVPMPFRKTIPPTTKGGVSTVITGVLPDCENCATVTTAGPVPFVTTIYPAFSDDIPTVVICEGPPTDSEFVITRVLGPKSDIATIPSGTVPGTAAIPYLIDDSDDYTTTVKTLDCTTDCTMAVRITTVPSFTSKTDESTTTNERCTFTMCSTFAVGLLWVFPGSGIIEPREMPMHPADDNGDTWSHEIFQGSHITPMPSPGLAGTVMGTDVQYDIVQHITCFHPDKTADYTFST